MQRIFLTLLACLGAAGAEACPWCRPRAQAGIYTPAYTTTALLVLLPVMVLLAWGIGLFYWNKLRPYFSISYGRR